jgi:hypothetical protein
MNSLVSNPLVIHATTRPVRRSASLSSLSKQVSLTGNFAQPDDSLLVHPTLRGAIIKHIPKSARQHCASQLKTVLNNITNDPTDLRAWSNLLNFGNTMLLAPPRGGKKHNLTSLLKARSITDDMLDVTARLHVKRNTKSEFDLMVAAVKSKIEDGNIKSALRLLSSEDKRATDDDSTIAALQAIHPSAASDKMLLPPPRDFIALQVSEADLIAAVRSFPAGSAGGPDGIRPQHILDLINNKEAGPALITSLTKFINLLLAGRCPDSVTPVYFGGNLIALEKKCGGIRPIAIGYTLRRLAAKCANNHALITIGSKLLPEQLGLGTPKGCEAAIHATRRFVSHMPANHVIAKLDFSNAFNNIHRDTMLIAVSKHVPQIYRFCHSAYENTSLLKFSNHTILSQEGCQQGDPLGPLLFCLAIHPLIVSCNSSLKLAFMDDVTLGGPAAVVAADVAKIKAEGTSYGLFLNDKKCEVITTNGQPPNDALLSKFIQLTPSSASLLGAPLTKGEAMNNNLTKRCNELDIAIERLNSISSHDALLLLKASFSAPKVQHTLRSSPCYEHTALSRFDMSLRTAICKICNINLSDDQWLQASLPVRSGGLGVRRVFSLALPAFLASAVDTRELQHQILRFSSTELPDIELDTCLSLWQQTYDASPPNTSSASKQKMWDRPVVNHDYEQLMERLQDDHNKARLLAASSDHSGDWLHALPISSCGLRLDDNTIRIAVGLRLGSYVCEPHTCICGAFVNSTGSHAFSCKKSTGRLIRHNYLNNVVYRSLTRALIPATKEPAGLLRTDGKRPDGMTMVPWREGRCLVWDVTVADTTAASYLASTSVSAGSAAELAASRKESKYVDLSQHYEFVPVAIETHGSFSASALSFLKELGRRLTVETSDIRETSFLFQRISIALQQFNAVCLMNTFNDATAVDNY